MLKQKLVSSVLNKFKKRDDWFLANYSVNPFEGCSCNCQYCYVRGSKYGENMEEGLVVKTNLPEILEKQLKARARKGQYGFVVVGSATDAYLHHEKEWRITEKILELLLKFRFPVFISTKCDLIVRDIDLLKEIDRTAILPDDLANTLGRGVILSVSVSTMNERISDALEPGAISPLRRMQLVQQLKREGFLMGVNAIPTLPFISDSNEELENTISSAKRHDADYILIGGLTLFGNDPADSKTLYYKFLERRFPGLIGKYEAMYRNLNFPPKTYHDELAQRANSICIKHKIRNRIIE